MQQQGGGADIRFDLGVEALGQGGGKHHGLLVAAKAAAAFLHDLLRPVVREFLAGGEVNRLGCGLKAVADGRHGLFGGRLHVAVAGALDAVPGNRFGQCG